MNTTTLLIALGFGLLVWACTRFVGISNLQGKNITHRKRLALGFGIAAFVIVMLIGWLGE